MLRSAVFSAAPSCGHQTAAPACPCCEMKSSVQSGRKSGYDIFHCRGCGLGYVHPPPQAGELSNLYSIAPRNLPQRMKTYVERVATSANSPRREWFDRVIGVAQKYSGQQKLRILEVGSGYGAFVHYASKTHTVTGTEASKEKAEASNGMISNAEDCGFYERLPDRSLDLIYMEHVLEHVPNPVELLNNLVRLLSSQGVLVICVPNHGCLLSRMLRLKWGWTCPPSHLYYYQTGSLARLLRKFDLNVLEASAGDYFFRSIYQFYSFAGFTNLVSGFLGRRTGLDVRPREHSYRYPTTIGDFANLAPYFLFYPLIQLANYFWGGSELLVVAGKNNSGTN